MLDITIIFIYLAITVLLGVKYSKKIDGAADYAIAKKETNYHALLLTSLATIIGAGSTLGTVSEIYKVGLIFMIPSLGYVVGSFIFAKFLALKFDERFKNMISVGDIIAYFYGEKASTIAAIIGFLYCTGIVGIQITAFGHIFHALGNVNYEISVLLGGLVTVFYSCVGGIRSVVITDIIQFCLLIVVFPLLSSILVNEAGGLIEISQKVDPSKLLIFDHKEVWAYLILFVALSLPMHHLNPTLIQRYLMAKSPSYIRRIMYTYGFLKIPLVIILAFIALSALVLYSHSPPDKVLNMSILNVLPTVIKGLTISGIFAVIMSTADSNINTAGILLSHNVLMKHFPKVNEVALMKVTSFASGMLAISIALLKLNIIRSIMDLELIWGLMIGIPTMIGIMNINRFKNLFWYCTLITVVSFAAYYLFSYTVSMVTLTSSLFTLGVMLVYSYKKRDVHYSHTRLSFSPPFKKKRDKNRSTHTSSLLNTLLTSLNKRFEKSEANFRIYGVFCCFNYIVPYFMWGYEKINNINVIITLRFISGVVCVLLLLKDYWPKKALRYFSLYWYFALLLTLPFFTTFMVMNNSESTFWFINIALSIFLLSMLVDWVSFLILSLVGTTCSALAYTVLIGFSAPITHFETLYNGIYIIAFSCAISFMFGRRKEGIIEVKLNSATNMAGILSHEIKSSLVKASLVTAQIKKNIGTHLNTTNLDTFVPKLDSTLKDATQLVDDILIKLKQENNRVELNVLSIQNEINKALAELSLQESEQKRIKIAFNDDFTFLGHRILFKHVLHNLMKNSLHYIKSKKDAVIEITTEMNEHGNCLIFNDTGEGIEEHDLEHIFKNFYSKRPNGTGCGLFFCKEVMNVFGGDISCVSEKFKFTEFRLEFPKIDAMKPIDLTLIDELNSVG